MSDGQPTIQSTPGVLVCIEQEEFFMSDGTSRRMNWGVHPRSSPAGSSRARARVEPVADQIPQRVECQHCDENRYARR